MKKITIISISILIILISSYYFYSRNSVLITYDIDNENIVLDKNFNFRQKEITDPPSTIRYFGNEVQTDLDDDGKVDSVFIITINSGGTGTFFYIVANLNKGNHTEGSKGFFIGDRISPQNTEIGIDNTIIVNYADRGDDEPFSVEPSYGKSLRLRFNKQNKSFEKI